MESPLMNFSPEERVQIFVDFFELMGQNPIVTLQRSRINHDHPILKLIDVSNVNITIRGKTPLLSVFDSGLLTPFVLLLSKKANPEQLDHRNKRPIELALKQGRMTTVWCLLQFGCKLPSGVNYIPEYLDPDFKEFEFMKRFYDDQVSFQKIVGTLIQKTEKYPTELLIQILCALQAMTLDYERGFQSFSLEIIRNILYHRHSKDKEAVQLTIQKFFTDGLLHQNLKEIFLAINQQLIPRPHYFTSNYKTAWIFESLLSLSDNATQEEILKNVQAFINYSLNKDDVIIEHLVKIVIPNMPEISDTILVPWLETCINVWCAKAKNKSLFLKKILEVLPENKWNGLKEWIHIELGNNLTQVDQKSTNFIKKLIPTKLYRSTILESDKCYVCLESGNKKDLLVQFQLCDSFLHVYWHQECLREHMASLQSIKCVDEGCQRKLNEQELLSIYSEKEIKYFKILYAQKNGLIRCKIPNCLGTFLNSPQELEEIKARQQHISQEMKSLSWMACPLCQTFQCILCDNLHGIGNCMHSAQKWENERHTLRSRPEFSLLPKETRLCPYGDCKSPIEKNGGCENVTCAKCKRKFKWLKDKNVVL